MFLDFYQHLPEYINPIAFSIGFFSIRWYSLMFIASVTVVYFLLNLNKRDILLGENQKLLLYIFIGILIGGRLGYVLFYDPAYFLQNPLEIFLPLNIKACYMLQATCYTGFYGMSYHGGLIGAILGGIIFAKKRGINFWKLADWVASAAPAGYFFGRVGNFLNGELYGRATDMPWGMYFGDGISRHPSQLYEAFFEGIILFILLWILSDLLKNKWREYYFPGILFSAYLFGYGSFRFMLEFFREPDAQLGFILGSLTMGQILSAGMAISSLIIFCQKKRDVV